MARFQVKSSDQGVFSSIKNFDPGRKWFYRSIGSDYPCTFIPPIDALATGIKKFDRQNIALIA